MTKKTLLAETKDSMVDAAQAGFEGVREVAGEALGAAAAAATAVVFERAVGALAAGERQIQAAAPAAAEAARVAAAQPFMSATAAKATAHKYPKTATKKAARSMRSGSKGKSTSRK